MRRTYFLTNEPFLPVRAAVIYYQATRQKKVITPVCEAAFKAVFREDCISFC